MKKRIMAWILLACFILLLLNIFIFRIYMEASSIAYIIIVTVFLLKGGNLFRPGEKGSNGQADTDLNDGSFNDGQNSYGEKTTDGKNDDM